MTGRSPAMPIAGRKNGGQPAAGMVDWSVSRGDGGDPRYWGKRGAITGSAARESARMGRNLIDLSDRRARDERLAGGKASRLAILLQKGFPVPSGFVVSTAVFDAQRRRADAAGGGGEPAGNEPRPPIDSPDLDPDLAGDLDRAFRRLGGPVAVRSSMRGEDASAHSYAGQLDSRLDVRDEAALARAVTDCWKALAGDRIAAYRRGREVDAKDGDPTMAVLVQRMVPAVAAGVAFGADPNSGRRCVIIEAVPGLGEKLAAGRAEPDRYVVDARGRIEGRSFVDEDRPVLGAGRILELASLVESAGCLAGEPQDVEWAWDGEDFFLLQSRPITSLAGRDVYSSRLVSDMIPGLIKPLVWSTSVRDMMENVFGRLFRELTGRRDMDARGLVRLVNSRVYANMTGFGAFFAGLGMPANAMEMMARGDRLAACRRRPMPAPTPRLLRFLLRHGGIARNARRFVDRHTRRMTSFRDADRTRTAAPELLEEARRQRAYHGETQWHMWLAAMGMAIRHKALARFIRSRAPGVDASELLRGRAGLRSIEPNDEMRRIAGLLADLDPATVAEIRGGDDGAIRRRLACDEAGRAVMAEVDRFIERFGHLSVNATDFSRPPWAETPSVIWRGIGRLVGLAERRGNAGAERSIAAEKVRRRLGPVGRLVFRRLLSETNRFIALRDRVSLCMSEDGWQMRRVCLALGERLAEADMLGDRDDVFMLAFDELAALVGGDMSGDRARRVVSERRAAMARDETREPPEVFCGDEPPATPPVEEGTTSLSGIPGSAGVARGIARIVTDPAEVRGRLSGEDILVVPFTDPGWTPLFPGIGGIVAETGGSSRTARSSRGSTACRPW